MKAQVSVDLIIVLSALFIIFLVVTVTVNYRQDEILSSRSRYNAKSVLDNLASEINSIYLAGDGTSKIIQIPSSLRDGKNFSINIYPDARFIEITWPFRDQKMRYNAPLVSSGISGDLTGINSTTNISNNNGVIRIIR